MGEDICIQCNSKVISVQKKEGGYDQKCVNPKCSVYYVLVKSHLMYDIDRFPVKGKNEMQNRITDGKVQVFLM
jgi:hypothetical protein